jgi:hypothetical protein
VIDVEVFKIVLLELETAAAVTVPVIVETEVLE